MLTGGQGPSAPVSAGSVAGHMVGFPFTSHVDEVVWPGEPDAQVAVDLVEGHQEVPAAWDGDPRVGSR